MGNHHTLDPEGIIEARANLLIAPDMEDDLETHHMQELAIISEEEGDLHHMHGAAGELANHLLRDLAVGMVNRHTQDLVAKIAVSTAPNVDNS